MLMMTTMMRKMPVDLSSRRFEMVWLLIATNLYIYYLVLRLGRGRARLMALMVLLPPFLVVPWRAPTVPERAIQSFLFHWMITSKLLLMVWGSGPAADPLALSSFPRFFSALTFSLHMKRTDERRPHQVLHRSSSKSQQPLKNINHEEDAIGQDGEVGHKKGADTNGHRVTGGADMSDGGVTRRNSKSQLLSRELQNEDGVLRMRASAAADSELVETGKYDDKRRDSKGMRSWMAMVVNSQSGYMVGLRAMFFFVVTASMVRTLLAWTPLPVMDSHVLTFMYGFVVYFACLFIFEAAAAIPACVLGVQLDPNFNMPFLADSLGDFWGRRWNLLINNLLRVSVYDPMVGALEKRGGRGGERKNPKSKRQIDRATSSFAVFLVSGIMHEIIFFYMTQTRPTWEVTAFFVVNGVATIAEGFIKKSGLINFELPRPMKRMYTIGFVYLTGYYLFIPPLDHNGHLDLCLRQLGRFADWVQGLILLGPQSLLYWTAITA